MNKTMNKWSKLVGMKWQWKNYAKLGPRKVKVKKGPLEERSITQSCKDKLDSIIRDVTF